MVAETAPLRSVESVRAAYSEIGGRYIIEFVQPLGTRPLLREHLVSP